MGGKKFGLFKGRSREQHEQPSTENLLHTSSSCDTVPCPSPIPSTSRGYQRDDGACDFQMMRVDSDDDDDDSDINVARRVALARAEETKLHYRALSPSETSLSTLRDLQDLDVESQLDLDQWSRVEYLQKFELPTPDDATSIDINSIQLDASSLASQEVRYCGATAPKKKKNKPRANQDLTDEEMWAVPNSQVIERLLERNCTINELIKWEAIALSRGICTLTTNCVCKDCNPGATPHALTDGDAGMANASFLSAVSVGCHIQ